MRRSKVFLGIGAFLLAAVGAIAATTAPTATTYYYYSSATVCSSVVEDFTCNQAGTTCEGVTGSANGKKLYRDRISSSECDFQLKKQ